MKSFGIAEHHFAGFASGSRHNHSGAIHSDVTSFASTRSTLWASVMY
jgi:hypothetical protein